MEKTLQNRLLYFFVAIFIITNLGFYKTYLIHFPTFKGFAAVYHIHGMLSMAWILMLIGQAYLIRAKKYDLHRLVGKFSYVIMPLFLASVFYAAKESYLVNIKTKPQADVLANLTNGGTIDIFFLGLGRFVFVFLGVPFPFALIPMLLCTTGVGIVWLILDIKNKKSAFPMGVYVAIALAVMAMGIGSQSAWWQGFAKWWVETLY